MKKQTAKTATAAKTPKSIGSFTFCDTAVGQIAINMNWYREVSTMMAGTTDWDSQPQSIGESEKIVPWGPNNKLPEEVRDLLEHNNLAPGILARKVGLLYGQGPALCRYEVQDNERIQVWLDDPDIQGWLDSWDYRRYIRECITEYCHLGGHFTRYHLNRGRRLGDREAKVIRLECLPSADCRLVWPANDMCRLDDVKKVIYGDFVNNKNLKRYPVFDKFHPSDAAMAIKYHSLRSFGRNFYAISCFHGSIPWLRNANDLPEIIRHLNENMVAAAYVVHSPQQYWDEKKLMLEHMHADWNEDKIQREMEHIKTQLTQTIADVMAGKGNVGKFFSVVDFVDEFGHTQSWKIEPIEMNIDKYIDAQQKVSRIADSSTTSGLGLSPALSNIIIDGKSDSGSQMLYALKIFYGADTQIPEEIALEAINDAIRINFPEKRGIFLSIYRKAINKEDNVTASARTSNNI